MAATGAPLALAISTVSPIWSPWPWVTRMRAQASQSRNGSLIRRVAKPWIDKDGGAGAFKFHGGVPVKGYFDAFTDKFQS